MIPLMKVHTPKGIGEKLQEVFDSGFLTEGEYSDEFEKQFGEYIGNPNVSLVNSCTSAIWLAGHMCDVQPGDEVITTAMTCMATNVPFINMGAKLKIADINPRTGNMDPKSIESLITDKTKAIVIVHWAGQPFDVDALMNFDRTVQADGYPAWYNDHIPVIEDAAHAIGAKYKGKPVGTVGDYGCFSFQAIKHPLANVLIAVEKARSLVYAAACALDQGNGEAPLLARMARVAADEAYGFATSRAIQFHGGFGFTDECDAHLFRRRAMASRVAFGSPAHHRQQIGALILGMPSSG